MCEIRAAMSRSDCRERNEEKLDRLLRRRDCWGFVKDERDEDEEWEEVESEEAEEFRLTFFAHLEIASSTFAAIAPRRPNDEAEDSVDMIEGEMEGVMCG